MKKVSEQPFAPVKRRHATPFSALDVSGDLRLITASAGFFSGPREIVSSKTPVSPSFAFGIDSPFYGCPFWQHAEWIYATYIEEAAACMLIEIKFYCDKTASSLLGLLLNPAASCGSAAPARSRNNRQGHRRA